MVLNIQIIVDAIALLTHEEPQQTVFLFDDNVHPSKGRGSIQLSSAVYPGQMVRWSVLPMDVQAPVWLKNIRFCGMPGTAEQPNVAYAAEKQISSLFWQGYVPTWLVPGNIYPYEVTLGFGPQSARTVSVNGPELIYTVSAAYAEPTTTSCL